jgi:tetratricopeptide (TPR) repeat protein
VRRGAHRSRSTAGDSAQIRLDFDSAATAEPVAAAVAAPAMTAPARVAPAMAPPVRLLDRRRAAAPAPERSAADWFEVGCEAEARSPAEAKVAYRHAIEADDRHADAHLNLGRLLHETGDLRGAERHYLRALEVEPDEATAAFNLGVVLEDLHRDPQAIEAYERATISDPDFVDAYHNLVRLHERRGDKPAALRVLKRLRGRTR